MHFEIFTETDPFHWGISILACAAGGIAPKSHLTGTAAEPPNLTRLVHNTASYAGYFHMKRMESPTENTVITVILNS